MTQKDIVDGSKIIANYLGWQYIPFDNLQGYSKPGWWQIPLLDEKGKLFDYMSTEVKNHRSKIGGRYYVCRNHGELRFWNSLDALEPVLKKLKEDPQKFYFELGYNSCEIYSWKDPFFKKSSDDNTLRWSNNIFLAIVETLKSLENDI